MVSVLSGYLTELSVAPVGVIALTFSGLTAANALANDLWQSLVARLAMFQDANPILALGLILVILAPLLAIAGWLLMPRAKRPAAVADWIGPEAVDREFGFLCPGDRPDTRLRIDEVGLTIGAAAHADLVIDGPGIAEVHARVVSEDGVFRLISLAGADDVAIYVNGKRQLDCVLAAGDTIKIGASVLTFETDCPALDELAVHAKRSKTPRQNGAIRSGGKRWQGGAVEATVQVQGRSLGR